MLPFTPIWLDSSSAISRTVNWATFGKRDESICARFYHAAQRGSRTGTFLVKLMGGIYRDPGHCEESAEFHAERRKLFAQRAARKRSSPRR